MAVVQISRIQIRRGKKNTGTGMPQLASGELAWAIDAQELWIGNGAVGEGAPAVGNTRILTDSDNILDIAGTYSYKIDDSLIQSGSDVNYPVTRSLQERLDERVTSASYGIASDGTDQAAAIQRIISNLYITNVLNGAADRVVIEFLPGVFNVSTTIYIPSYVTLIGAGRQKTIFNFTGNSGNVFAFVDSTSSVGTYNFASTINSGATAEYNQQPKYIVMKGFTIQTNEPDVGGFYMDCVRDSHFEDIEIEGTFGDSAGDSTVVGGGNGMTMFALSSVVTCQRNKFNNIKFYRCEYAVHAQEDIYNNQWQNCEIIECRYGFDFGTDLDPADPLYPLYGSTGFQYGPRRNLIRDCYFDDVERYGIRITHGTYNRSRGNTFINVGNDGSGNTNNQYACILFTDESNSSVHDTFDRQVDLATTNFGETYLPEVDGTADWSYTEPNKLTLNYLPYNGNPDPTSWTTLFRLPYGDEIGFEVKYVLRSAVGARMRSGKFFIAVDQGNNTLQMTEEYNYTGAAMGDEAIEFDAVLSGGSVLVKYYNDSVGDTSYFTYTYSAIS